MPLIRRFSDGFDSEKNIMITDTYGVFAVTNPVCLAQNVSVAMASRREH
jgi:hypothetical protein